MLVKKLLKDPLTHFFAAGIVLFIALSLTRPVEKEDYIVIDRDVLTSFIQYRSKAFEPRAAASLLDQMNADVRQRLIDDYIREEALYREARALGLDAGDYVIRRRMVQKLEFMAEAASTPLAPDDAAIAAYYEANKQDYFENPSATFAHIFISTKDRSVEAAVIEAQQTLATLRERGAKFEDATQYGDRFLYHTNYVERAYPYIKSHFGFRATDFIFSADAQLSKWSGPVLSDHGVHLFFVTSRTQGHTPELEKIKPLVIDDMALAKRREQTDSFLDGIISEYTPVIKAVGPTVGQAEKTSP